MLCTNLSFPVPQATPASLQVAVGANEGELHVSWGPIASCVDYGGPLIGYVIQYKTTTQATFDEQEVGVETTPLTFTLTGLQPSTMYQVKVAAKTSLGAVSYTHLTLPTIYSV